MKPLTHKLKSLSKLKDPYLVDHVKEIILIWDEEKSEGLVEVVMDAGFDVPTYIVGHHLEVEPKLYKSLDAFVKTIKELGSDVAKIKIIRKEDV